MPTVECVDLFGQMRNIPQEQVELRPACYAIVIRDGQLLLLRLRATGKYHLPGGGIEPGEWLQQTLERELREECGIEIRLDRFVHFEELFFYYNPSDRAYHGLHFFYACTPITDRVIEDDAVVDGSAERPSWVPIGNLNAEDFQIHGDKILDLCHRVASAPSGDLSGVE